MWWLLVLVAKTQAFGPVSVQWAGDTARNFVLAPRGLASTASVAAQSLIVIHRPSSTSPVAIPQFTFNTDGTITLGSMEWCVDAAVCAGRNKDEVRINRCDGKPTQKFNLVEHGVGRKSYIQMVGTSKCLTIRDVTHKDKVSDGTPIVLRDCDGKVPASWQLVEVSLVPSHGLLPQSIHSFTLQHVMISFAALATLGILNLSRWLRPVSGQDGVPLREETGGVSLMAASVVPQGGSPLIAQVDMKEQEMVPTVMVHNPEPLEETGFLSSDVRMPKGMQSGKKSNFVMADEQKCILTMPDGAEGGQSEVGEVPAALVLSRPSRPRMNAPSEEALPLPQIAPMSTIEVASRASASQPVLEVWHGARFWEERHTRFLDEFWQTRPLLIRQLFSADEIHTLCPLTPKELLDIACEDGVTSRLIEEDCGSHPWQLSDGPFHASQLDSLPPKGWSVLVNDVDTMVPEVERLREKFDFVPRWRLDDVMVSFAPAGGSIGAHCDNYDVFLLQGRGERTWSLETCPRPASAEILQPGLDVRVLQSFEPNSSLLLEPGDAIYIPPRHAHHGVSNHAECLTYSVGFRTPTAADLIQSFGTYAANLQASDSMLDVPACDKPNRGQIDAAVLTGARQFLTNALSVALNDEAFDRWMGETLTKPRRSRCPADSPSSSLVEDNHMQSYTMESGGSVEAAAETAIAEEKAFLADIDEDFEAMSPAAIVTSIVSGSVGAPTLRHSEGSVLAFVEDKGGSTSLFVDGVHVPCETEAERYIPLLCSSASLLPGVLQGPLSRCSALRRLVEQLIMMDGMYVDLPDTP